jgi:hypothetical protein
MEELHRLEAKSLARAKLRAKRRRVRAIRARATVGSVVLFAVAWAIVFGQLVTGNDPVLNRSGYGAARPVASIQRERPAAAAPPARQLEAESDESAAPVAVPEPEAAPEPEPEAAPEPEIAPEPEPASVITSAS